MYYRFKTEYLWAPVLSSASKFVAHSSLHRPVDTRVYVMLTFLQNTCVIVKALTFSPSHPTLIFLPAVLIFLPFSVISEPWQLVQITDKSWRMLTTHGTGRSLKQIMELWLDVTAPDDSYNWKCRRLAYLIRAKGEWGATADYSYYAQQRNGGSSRRHLYPLPLQTTCYIYSATCWENA